MQIKTHDNYQNERLQLLMEAVGNSLLEGELCPNCFEQYSTLEFRKIASAVMKSTETDQVAKGPLREAIEQMKALKEDSTLTIKDSSDEIIKEYLCKKCRRSYVGELNLIANLSETQVLAFFGHDDTRSYKKDFYSFSLIDDSYDSFVKELWEKEIDPSVEEATITPRFIQDTTEDAISGEVLGMLKRFFVKFSRAVYSDIGSEVGVYSVYHAGTIESGRREGVPASGADAAIWIGPMTKEDMKAISDYVNGIRGSELPVRVGNGVILQAKKEIGGKIDRKQIEDLMKYASIEYKGHEYLGVPGKLFMNYSIKPPFVTVLSCDYTYRLYLHSKELPENQKSISFPMSLKELAEHVKPIDLPDFVQSYLAGKIGTPLLMLQDIFATPGPKLVVGLPPELLNNPSKNRQSPLAGVVERLVEALGQRLQAIEESEVAYAEQEQYYEERSHAMEREQSYEVTHAEEQYGNETHAAIEQAEAAYAEQERYYEERLREMAREQRHGAIHEEQYGHEEHRESEQQQAEQAEQQRRYYEEERRRREREQQEAARRVVKPKVRYM